MNSDREDLLELLKIHTAEINRMIKKYHASVDNSGAVPQLLISKR